MRPGLRAREVELEEPHDDEDKEGQEGGKADAHSDATGKVQAAVGEEGEQEGEGDDQQLLGKGGGGRKEERGWSDMRMVAISLEISLI